MGSISILNKLEADVLNVILYLIMLQCLAFISVMYR